MKILTIGASPYLLVRNGKINSDIIKSLKDRGHEVFSAVWHHDEGYFLPTDGGIHNYEDSEGNVICELYPFIPQSQQSESIIYEIMKKIQPQVVVTIGDYKEIDFVYSIKALYPTLFKWISIQTIECPFINEHHKDRLEYADYTLSTSKFGWKNLEDLCNVRGEFLPYGPDHNVFKLENNIKDCEPTFIFSGKNVQSTNISSFIKCMGKIQKFNPNYLKVKMHTNIYDPGDYDLDLLIERYGATNVSLPSYFCSVKDSISSQDLAKEYKSAHFIVETSFKSATALSLLEAMSMGCVPIGMKHGRVGEIISLMPKEYQFFIDFDIFVGPKEEEFAIFSENSLYDAMLRASELSKSQDYNNASNKSIEIAKKFSNFDFTNKVTNIIENSILRESPIVIETFLNSKNN